MNVAIDAFLARPEPATASRLHEQATREDSATERMIEFDAAQGQRLGLEIARTHAEARLLVLLLDGIAVFLAVVATTLALRQLRRAAQAQAVERASLESHERELAAQNEALGQFAGRVAHDVVSPLATTQLALDLLRETSSQAPASQRIVERGTAALHRVHRLVQDLLAFSRAGGRPELGTGTEVTSVVTDVTGELATQAQQQRITLTVSEVPQGAVACSAGVLTSLLANLLRNAIKHMGDATDRRIELRVTTIAERWRFEIEDTGPGIPPDQKQQIFEPYVQLGRPRGGGIGLGLATVDRLVRAHGGTVGVDSELGRGARFWFELPAFSTTHQVLVP
jgi:signal transduction histidine kinase